MDSLFSPRSLDLLIPTQSSILGLHSTKILVPRHHYVYLLLYSNVYVVKRLGISK